MIDNLFRKEITMQPNKTILGALLKKFSPNFVWDFTKDSAKAIFDKLKDKFIKESKAFLTEEQLTKFIEKLTTREPNSTKNPYIDVDAVYQDIVDEPDEKFVEEFKKWLSDNAEMFKAAEIESNQTVTNYGIHNTGTFTNHGGGSIEITTTFKKR